MRDAPGIGLGEREKVDGDAAVRRVGVEPLEERFNRTHVLHAGRDEQGVGPLVRDDGDGFHRLALHARRAVRDDGLERRLQFRRRRPLERKDLEVEP